ncbi:hypothetical protein EON66_07225 [archaeon]|nr:MAG: hypothetical protein EON66_07225 [archaeon]
MTSEDSSRWSDVDDETLRSFDMHDDDISGRDPFVMVYTVPWARAVLQAVRAHLTRCGACSSFVFVVHAHTPAMQPRVPHCRSTMRRHLC